MKTTFTVQGGRDLERRLRELPDGMSRKVQVSALKEGAEPMRAKAAELAPRSDEAPHMADHIVVSELSQRDRDAISAFDDVVVAVGPERKFFYGYFLEYGTAHQPAQPFMRPAFDTKAQTTLGMLASLLWQRIKRSTQFKEDAENAGASRGRGAGGAGL